jgi:hypothetical protein
MCGSAFSKAEHLRGNTRPKSSDTVYSSPSFLQIWPFSKYPQLTVLSMDHPAIQAVSEFIINSTISFDGSVGRKAEEDIQLASFGKRLIFEPGEPDASEKTPSKPRSPSPPPRAAHEGGNHALQDYQMQLMLNNKIKKGSWQHVKSKTQRIYSQRNDLSIFRRKDQFYEHLFLTRAYRCWWTMERK